MTVFQQPYTSLKIRRFAPVALHGFVMDGDLDRPINDIFDDKPKTKATENRAVPLAMVKPVKAKVH